MTEEKQNAIAKNQCWIAEGRDWLIDSVSLKKDFIKCSSVFLGRKTGWSWQGDRENFLKIFTLSKTEHFTYKHPSY